MRWRLIRSTADGLNELTVNVDEGRRSVDVNIVNRACLWQVVALSMKKAKGRLHPRLFGTLVCCNGTALSVLSGGEDVLRVFRDALDHRVSPQNPCEAIPRDGSSDQSVGCQELRGEWERHRVAELSTVHLSPGA